eukprot:2937642-Pyramimonas_sp.AAC.1
MAICHVIFRARSIREGPGARAPLSGWRLAEAGGSSPIGVHNTPSSRFTPSLFFLAAAVRPNSAQNRPPDPSQDPSSPVFQPRPAVATRVSRNAQHIGNGTWPRRQ